MARLLSGRGEGWIQAAQPGDFGFFLGGGPQPLGEGLPCCGLSPCSGWGEVVVLGTGHHAPPPVSKRFGL